MAATTTKLGIVNRALQILGVQSVTALTENSRGAKAMLRAYDQVLLAELRSHTWNFAIKRASLAADATRPIFGKTKYFPLPGDFLFLAPEETTLTQPRRRDYNIEGLSIVSDMDAPLEIRYVSSNITESQFDVLFAEAFAYSLARAACEEITNSNTKLNNIRGEYIEIIRTAKKRNAIENAPVKQPTPTWVSVRL